MSEVEARVPDPLSAHLVAGEVGDVHDVGAEAGRADHRAVAAGQAPGGDVVPHRAVGAGVQQVLEAGGVQAAAHPPRRSLRDRVGRVAVRPGGGSGVEAVHQVGPALGSNLDQEAVAVVVEHLGHRQVVRRTLTRPRTRPGAHGGAEAGAAGITAGDRDHEGVGTSYGVGGVDVRAPEQHRVVDAQRAQVAGAHAQEGERPLVGRRAFDGERVGLTVRAPEQVARGEEHRLRRLRAVGVAEDQLVVPPAQPVGAGVLLVPPADREVRDLGDGAVPDRAVAHHRRDHLVPVAGERVHEPLETVR